MQFRHEQLPNGLDIVAEVSEAAHSASLGFFVKTGARDEYDDISGASHFLEHMVFKGTDTLSAEDINLRFDFTERGSLLVNRTQLGRRRVRPVRR